MPASPKGRAPENLPITEQAGRHPDCACGQTQRPSLTGARGRMYWACPGTPPGSAVQARPRSRWQLCGWAAGLLSAGACTCRTMLALPCTGSRMCDLGGADAVSRPPVQLSRMVRGSGHKAVCVYIVMNAWGAQRQASKFKLHAARSIVHSIVAAPELLNWRGKCNSSTPAMAIDPHSRTEAGIQSSFDVILQAVPNEHRLQAQGRSEVAHQGVVHFLDSSSLGHTLPSCMRSPHWLTF